MGYKIPGADYTSPAQLQTNVGAEVGKSLGNVFAQFGQQLRQANEQAKKTAAVEGQIKDTIRINYSKSVNKILSAGKEQFGDDQVLYNEWKSTVIEKGEEATQAQIDFQFGELDAKQKKEKLDIVGGFETWLAESKQNYGRFLTDVTDMNTDGMRIVGDTTNGEQQLNQIILTANSGGNAVSLFGDGATMTRSLSGNNKEIINTTVRIPVNSETIKTLNSKSGGTSNNVFEQGVLDGIIKKVDDGTGKEYYEFKKNIDTSRYGSGQHDFVIPVETAMKPGETFKELGLVDDKMTIQPNLYAKTASGDPAIYTTTSSENAPPGKERTTTSEIINIAQIRGNEALRVQINSEVDGILLDSRNTDAKLASFSAYGIESLDNFKDLKYDKEENPNGYKSLREFLDKADANVVKTFTDNVVTQTLFDGLFNKTDGSGNRTYTQMSADKKMVNFLNKNNILNEAGEAYKTGDVVYVKNKVTEQDKESGEGNVYQNILNQLNAPDANPASILSSPIQIPKGNKIGYDAISGEYVIYGSDGTPGDITLTLDEVKMQLQRGI
tara:strand:+ start:21284 stop:22942 length:1659 start_codon:yes stop_codon:yes gene_type:complete